ncbi:MAG: DUF3551 domain-containing protein [Rhizobiales bacterium]|nr:DUF3551 domain-containing protein [Hyphomicrobiales bacterium]
MRSVLAGTAALAAVLATDTQSVQAQVSSPRNPYCIRDGVNGRGTWDCGYYNWQQCLASASGAGGWCTENPNYQPRKSRQRQRRRY